jgi:phosphoribosylformylglycinamidine cyclo-ligase
MGLTYKDSGVDINAGDNFVKKIAPLAASTFSDRVITGIGGFGALYSGAFPGYEDPVLVSGTDGVGTKLKIAQMMGKHDTIGIDAVAMCVNDIVTSGAQPLFFLDYLACGRLDERVLVDIVRGLAEGCRMAGCSLVGGETAEHPSVMREDDYDIAGFAVGVVDRKKIIDGADIRKGDVIIGLPSSGVHSNGYSLVRKLFFDIKKYNVETFLPALGESLGSALLSPTRIYVKSILACLASGIKIKGLVHITGGGFYGNIPRILPANAAARIERGSFKTPAIFGAIQQEGKIEDREMFTTFNMGIGMMLMVAKGEADRTMENLKKSGESPAVIGGIIERTGEPVQII